MKLNIRKRLIMDHLKVKVTGVWILITIVCALSVEGAAYGENCTSSTCSETGNICGSNNNCTCSSTTFRKNNTTECATKIVLNTVCEVSESADQCEDSLAECRNDNGFKCLCKDNHFEKKTGLCAPRKAFNGTCDNTDSAADQCLEANMGCLNQGLGIYQCLCNSNYYEEGGTCYERRKPYEDCEEGRCVVHATCNTNCTCDMGYEASPVVSPTQCNGGGRETVALLYLLTVANILSQMLLSL
ncbi:24 kDa ookinete surface protein-like [Mytilus trossulus]|uniref:24 kDa ookinete surface protein-like n=1 Tax=Mytilus trossulus TaxID=6551 RepID=UPI003006154F